MRSPSCGRGESGGNPWKWQGSAGSNPAGCFPPPPAAAECLPSPAGIFIFIWLVALYYPKTKEATGSLSHIIRHDKTTMAS